MAKNDVFSLVLSDEDLLEKYHESRKANLKLLEQRREMLVELQRARGDRPTGIDLAVKCEQLQKRVEELEGKLAEKEGNEDFSTTNTTDKDISSEESATCKCSCASHLKETVKVNHQWNEAYKRSVARIHDVEKRARRLDAELKLEVEENAKLIDLVNTLQNDLKNQDSNGYLRINSLEEVCSKDDVEALKLQMLTFQDDFNKEKAEKEKSIKESTMLQAMLDESRKTNQSLSDKVTLYKQQIMKLTQNQEHLYKQIRALANDNGSHVHLPMQRQLSYRHSYPMDIQGTSMEHRNGASRFSDADLFSGGRVVRDALCDC